MTAAINRGTELNMLCQTLPEILECII